MDLGSFKGWIPSLQLEEPLSDSYLKTTTNLVWPLDLAFELHGSLGCNNFYWPLFMHCRNAAIFLLTLLRTKKDKTKAPHSQLRSTFCPSLIYLFIFSFFHFFYLFVCLFFLFLLFFFLTWRWYIVWLLSLLETFISPIFMSKPND